MGLEVDQNPARVIFDLIENLFGVGDSVFFGENADPAILLKTPFQQIAIIKLEQLVEMPLDYVP